MAPRRSTPRFYGYGNCSTCRQAKKHLASLGVAFDEIDITTNPPPKTLIHAILNSGNYQLQELFNRSGQMYRQLNMKEKIRTTAPDQLITLLALHGKLVKRPIVTDGIRHTVGFKAQVYDRVWGNRL